MKNAPIFQELKEMFLAEVVKIRKVYTKQVYEQITNESVQEEGKYWTNVYACDTWLNITNVLRQRTSVIFIGLEKLLWQMADDPTQRKLQHAHSPLFCSSIFDSLFFVLYWELMKNSMWYKKSEDMYVCHYTASRPKLPEGEEMTTSADQQSGRNLTKLGEIWTAVGDVNQPEINNFNDSFRIP